MVMMMMMMMMMMPVTYVVADVENAGEVGRDVGVITRHERRVADNTQRDEQVDERVHDEQLHVMSEPIPARRALPAEQQLVDLVHQFLAPRPIIFHVDRLCNCVVKHAITTV